MKLPTVLHDSERLFVAWYSRAQWQYLGCVESWWAGYDWDPGHVGMPARYSRPATLRVRLCGVELTYWIRRGS